MVKENTRWRQRGQRNRSDRPQDDKNGIKRRVREGREGETEEVT